MLTTQCTSGADGPAVLAGVRWGLGMSHEAIAAALARPGLTGGERLVAFSLASFAGRDRRAWPGAAAAAARAGLSRSRYLHDRGRLVQKGLVDVEDRASGRRRASTIFVRFAAEGPWWEGEINARLFEEILARTRARGSARLLLAAMAALADADGLVCQLSNDELRSAAGLGDRTFRRARPELVASGELELRVAARGRGNTNVWHVPGELAATGYPLAGPPRRVPPLSGARPLLASVERPVLSEIPPRKGGQRGTPPPLKCRDSPGVPVPNDGHDGTLVALVPAKKPAENQAQTPAVNARAEAESGNPRTADPPNPPGGRSARLSIEVEETYATSSGRKRHRRFAVDADDVRRGLARPTLTDQADWSRVQALLARAAGDSVFEIWLEPLVLVAVDAERRLLVAAPPMIAAWTWSRFGRLLETHADEIGRGLRLATDTEVQALAVVDSSVPDGRQEAIG